MIYSKYDKYVKHIGHRFWKGPATDNSNLNDYNS